MLFCAHCAFESEESALSVSLFSSQPFYVTVIPIYTKKEFNCLIPRNFCSLYHWEKACCWTRTLFSLNVFKRTKRKKWHHNSVIHPCHIIERPGTNKQQNTYLTFSLKIHFVGSWHLHSARFGYLWFTIFVSLVFVRQMCYADTFSPLLKRCNRCVYLWF